MKGIGINDDDGNEEDNGNDNNKDDKLWDQIETCGFCEDTSQGIHKVDDNNKDNNDEEGISVLGLQQRGGQSGRKQQG